jgi:hypothetical protein
VDDLAAREHSMGQPRRVRGFVKLAHVLDDHDARRQLD